MNVDILKIHQDIIGPQFRIPSQEKIYFLWVFQIWQREINFCIK